LSIDRMTGAVEGCMFRARRGRPALGRATIAAAKAGAGGHRGASYRAVPVAVKRAMRVLGFMTGTSLDAVDMAMLEADGEAITTYGPAGERKTSEPTRDIMLAATKAALAWPRGAPDSGNVRSGSKCRCNAKTNLSATISVLSAAIVDQISVRSLLAAPVRRILYGSVIAVAPAS